LCRLKELGIDLDAITEQLQADGITAFAASFDPVAGAVEEKRKRIVQAQSPPRERRNRTCQDSWVSKTVRRCISIVSSTRSISSQVDFARIGVAGPSLRTIAQGK